MLLARFLGSVVCAVIKGEQPIMWEIVMVVA
jgi:hypothetical protein